MKILRTVLVGSLVATVSFGVLAQSTGPRDLAELKQEAQRRADRSLPPVGGIKAEDMREALANTHKHARASEATVRLEHLAGAGVRLSVRDDGRGVAAADVWGDGREAGFGLLSLREQVEALGGSFGLDSTPNHGTTVWAMIPAAEVDDVHSSIDR